MSKLSPKELGNSNYSTVWGKYMIAMYLDHFFEPLGYAAMCTAADLKPKKLKAGTHAHAKAMKCPLEGPRRNPKPLINIIEFASSVIFAESTGFRRFTVYGFPKFLRMSIWDSGPR